MRAAREVGLGVLPWEQVVDKLPDPWPWSCDVCGRSPRDKAELAEWTLAIDVKGGPPQLCPDCHPDRERIQTRGL